MKITASLLALPLLMLAVSCGSDDLANAAGSALDSAKDASGSVGDMAGDMADKAGDMAGDMADKAGDMAGDLTESLGDIANLGKDGLAEKLGGVQPMITDAIDAIKAKTPNMDDMGEGMKEKLGTLMEYKDEIPGLLTKLKDGGMDGAGDLLTRAKEILTSLPELLKGLGN